MHMRKYILSLLILLLAAPITAQADNHAEKNSRYRCFAELGTSFNVGFYNPRGTGSISTTHGCQINSHLFVGAGLGCEYHEMGKRWFLPLFVDFRVNISDRKFTPFFGLKAGYALGKKSSDKLNPGYYVYLNAFGDRLIITPKLAMNMSIGYILGQCVHE